MARAIAKFGETFGISSLQPGLGHRELCQSLLCLAPVDFFVDAFLVSLLVVGLADVGDKTQILSMILAARFRQPMPIMFGILFATIANHAAAGLAGTLFGDVLSGSLMRWILGLPEAGEAPSIPSPRG
jgi:hypothetical protein